MQKKAFDKIQHTFMIKNVSKVSIYIHTATFKIDYQQYLLYSTGNSAQY